MARLNMVILHRFNRDEALQRTKQLLSQTKAEHADKISDLKERWDGNCGEFSFSVAGFSVSGTLDVSGSAITIDGKIPFAALLFKGKIESAIRDEAAKVLS